MESISDAIQKKLEFTKSKNRFRTLKNPHGIDISSNDYLCLSQHPKLIAALKEGIDRYGAGSTASRLIRGNRDIFTKFETEFSSFVAAESGLLVANGYAANSGLMDSIAGPDTIVFSDRLNHASILDGIRISGAKKIYFQHLDYSHLESQLAKYASHPKKILVVESLYSMDGDTIDLERIISFKEKYGLVLVVDDAHSFGVFGKQGRGILFANPDSQNLISKIDFRIYTLGKSMGLEGGIIVSSQQNIEFLVNTMRKFIFSTGIMPCIPFAGLVSLELISSMDVERAKIQTLAERFRVMAVRSGLQTTNSTTHIIPVLCNSEDDAITKSKLLEEHGIDVRAIRPPTVETSRLRFSLNAGVEWEVLEKSILLLSQQTTGY